MSRSLEHSAIASSTALLVSLGVEQTSSVTDEAFPSHWAVHVHDHFVSSSPHPINAPPEKAIPTRTITTHVFI
jgi:hypothetical protein